MCIHASQTPSLAPVPVTAEEPSGVSPPRRIADAATAVLAPCPSEGLHSSLGFGFRSRAALPASMAFGPNRRLASEPRGVGSTAGAQPRVFAQRRC
jgi:hypothetical protein